jgi:hypothetical protein
MFMQSLGLVVLTWPLVILAARHAHDANLIVLGGAILMGIIWILYGWATDDPVGLKHAIGRGLLSYVAFVYVPSPNKATGIYCVVLLAYLYSLLRMKLTCSPAVAASNRATRRASHPVQMANLPRLRKVPHKSKFTT